MFMEYSLKALGSGMLRTHWRGVLVGILLVTVVVGGVIVALNRDSSHGKRSEEEAKKAENAYQEILSGDPRIAQEMFAQDVANGINDALTKSNAYLVMERYAFRGDIYEIYDYVNSTPSLAFLREAEALQPGIFRKIRDRSLPVPSTHALYAFLAYLETLEKHGYANVALRATTAHMYAKNAYILTLEPERFDPGIDKQQNIFFKLARASLYRKLASEDVNRILDGSLPPDTLLSRDIVDGLSQYAAALGYLQYLGVDVSDSRGAREIFDFCIRYAREKAPEEEILVSYMYASTLLLDSGSTMEEVRMALGPVMDSELAILAKTNKNMRVLQEARSEQKRYFAGGEKQRKSYGLFERSNASALAKKVPEFRSWLMRGGWTETDFWD